MLEKKLLGKNWKSTKKIIKTYALALASLCVVLLLGAAGHASPAGGGETPLLGVDEGWAWPVIVIPPPEGWDGPLGESVKYGLRMAEREISRQREGIRGSEVTFMFSTIGEISELRARMNTWKGMNAGIVISFAGQELNEVLKSLCVQSGPCVIFAGGEDIAVKDPSTGMPYRYLFALDLPYFARANALSEYASAKGAEMAAIITDQLSPKLAKGAEENVRLLRGRGIDAFSMFVPAMTIYQFNAQVQTAESSGASVIASWLDSMSTLSIWRTTSMNRNGTVIHYPGSAHKFLLDAEGLILVDKDGTLKINEEGKRALTSKGLDMFAKSTPDIVTTAKAYALGKWTISAYVNAVSPDAPSLSLALSRVTGIPLLDETFSIDPRTNRPESRQYGVLRVQNRRFVPVGRVEVRSVETVE
ncbi:MAG: hypothetical protein LBT31_00325 [Synergistaceae bacterium]|nr:hypothetical protein [Synergistaceae bacterium]